MNILASAISAPPIEWNVTMAIKPKNPKAPRKAELNNIKVQLLNNLTTKTDLHSKFRETDSFCLASSNIGFIPETLSVSQKGYVLKLLTIEYPSLNTDHISEESADWSDQYLSSDKQYELERIVRRKLGEDGKQLFLLNGLDIVRKHGRQWIV
ncbi:hypothetical protein BC833DRAFT_626531 [Globomyces pollinis-pini]|nr:hypothetical protein BC833DRAFT_626531 [Globomyces pollinis-pini]